MIVRNEAECKLCGDRVYSRHHHDFRTCKCGAISVDGGREYMRRVGEPANIIDRSIVLPDSVVKACRAEIAGAEQVISDNKTIRNDLGIVCAILRTLQDQGYLNKE
jgi:hypothetical protein